MPSLSRRAIAAMRRDLFRIQLNFRTSTATGTFDGSSFVSHSSSYGICQQQLKLADVLRRQVDIKEHTSRHENEREAKAPAFPSS